LGDLWISQLHQIEIARDDHIRSSRARQGNDVIVVGIASQRRDRIRIGDHDRSLTDRGDEDAPKVIVGVAGELRSRQDPLELRQEHRARHHLDLDLARDQEVDQSRRRPPCRRDRRRDQDAGIN
jgi:hypothetical protein